MSFKDICCNLATHFCVEPASFTEEMRQLWDHRSAIVAACPPLAGKAMELWPRVLHATVDLAIPAARAAVGTFLVLQSESASCERVFARAEYIRNNLHEQKDGQLVEQYLWGGQGPRVGGLRDGCRPGCQGVHGSEGAARLSQPRGASLLQGLQSEDKQPPKEKRCGNYLESRTQFELAAALAFPCS